MANANGHPEDATLPVENLQFGLAMLSTVVNSYSSVNSYFTLLYLENYCAKIGLVFTCSCPMEGKPGEGPEAMDVTLICPAIWPMLLVAMETLRFMPLPLYMLVLFCWVNCGDACCCENIL